MDFELIFNELVQPRQLEELSYYTEHYRFILGEQESYSYVNGRALVFDTLRKLTIVGCSHKIRFVGHNVTTMFFEDTEMTVQDYLAMSQDTPNVESLEFAWVAWHTTDAVLELLDANKFGHRKVVKLTWRDIKLLEQDVTDVATSVIFSYILLQAARVHTLEITWSKQLIDRRVLQQTSPKLGAVEDLHISSLQLRQTNNRAFRTWITKFQGLQHLQISFRDAHYITDYGVVRRVLTHTKVVEALYNDLAPDSSVLTNSRLQKIEIRDSCVHVTALWGLHRACKSTIALRDHFLDQKSEKIDWPRDKDGDLVDLLEEADTEVASKRLRFIVN